MKIICFIFLFNTFTEFILKVRLGYLVLGFYKKIGRLIIKYKQNS